MADRTEGTITIDAKPAEIMGVIADFESYPEWANVRSVEVRERGSDGRGTSVHFEVSMGPMNARYTLVYTYRPGDSGISWRSTEASGALRGLEGEYVLEPEAAGTKVTYRLSAEINIPGPGFLKKNLMSQGQKMIIDTALKGLKKRVEGL